MPALPADIAAGTREARIDIHADAVIRARYPNARDGSQEPATGFFDSAADAATALAQRAALIAVERRRFAVVVQDVLWPDLGAGVPTLRLVDPEQAADFNGLAARIELSLEDETTSYEVFG